MESLRTSGSRRARLVYRACQNFPRVLSTSLVGNNLTNIILTVTVSRLTIQYFGDVFLGLMTGILTIILLVFGEFYPKQIAVQNCERWALLTIYPLYIFTGIFWPLSQFIRIITIRRSRQSDRTRNLTREHVLNNIALASNVGAFKQNTARLLINTVRFEEGTVQEVMTHRTNICSIPTTATIDQALRTASDAGFSRLPVYRDEQENIVGILFFRELLHAWRADRKNTSIETIMAKPYFVSQSRPLGQLLSQLRSEQSQIAIVLDEYGGLAGLVTVEDAIEKIFGELYDEHETVQQQIFPRTQHSFEIDASTPIIEINQQLSLSIPSARGQQTLSGYLIHLSDTVPQTDQEIASPFGNFRILQATRRRILKVLFTRLPDSKSAEKS